MIQKPYGTFLISEASSILSPLPAVPFCHPPSTPRTCSIHSIARQSSSTSNHYECHMFKNLMLL